MIFKSILNATRVGNKDADRAANKAADTHPADTVAFKVRHEIRFALHRRTETK